MSQEEVYTAIKERLDLLEVAMHDAIQAMSYNSRPELKMAIRDMGFLVFAMHQHFQRLPEHSVDLTQ